MCAFVSEAVYQIVWSSSLPGDTRVLCGLITLVLMTLQHHWHRQEFQSQNQVTNQAATMSQLKVTQATGAACYIQAVYHVFH